MDPLTAQFQRSSLQVVGSRAAEMAGQTAKQWGVTPPISTARPTENDRKRTEALVAELKAQNNYEAPDDTEKRGVVLKSLSKVTVEFIKHVGRKKGVSKALIDQAGGKIFTFGSYRLGVYGPGSDIDTLVVAPKHVTKDDFFEYYPTILKSMAPAGSIDEVTPVPDAFVPIIKLKYSNISIDLIFTKLVLSSIPQNLDLQDNNLLKGLDEVEMRCVNGTRVTDELLKCVPETKTFRTALRAIKLWAQRRAMYANIMGFPGGVAWAMMVARICQLYPYAESSVIVAKFFPLIKSWNWPQPVVLKDFENGPVPAKIWNPALYPGDKHHLMPIITPAFPAMCATHNITRSTMQVIISELGRAAEICAMIQDDKATWKDLFEKHSFFTQDYKYYLAVVAASKTKEAQAIWSGLVESKVRRLVSGIEQGQENIAIAHPFNKGFERVHKCRTEEEIDACLQGFQDYRVTEIKTETTDTSNNAAHKAAADGNADNMEMPKPDVKEEAKQEDDTQTIFTTTYYIGLQVARGANSLDISHPVSEFRRQCTMWPKYDNELNSIRIIHTKNTDLPDDVFGPGEVKPMKTKKTKKRPLANGISGAEPEPGNAKRHQATNGVAKAEAVKG